MQNTQKLPVDVHSFEIMRTQNYLYVDKTRHIYRMMTEGTFYFLSRPRRFGKSLLVSTLNCLFQGRKELFDGLWIAEHGDWDWQHFSVISIDFNTIPGRTPEELQQGLVFHLKKIARSYGITLEAPLLELQFEELILSLFEATNKPVVVVIDEYDKRIIEHLGKGEARLETAKEIRDVLKAFFGILKGQSLAAKLQLVFITGVSRFSKVSLFSDLNNLIDLSMEATYSDLLGYTQEELKQDFGPAVQELAVTLNRSPEEVMQTLQRYYNGYRFSERDIRVYNPFSILRAFRNQEIKEYWFESATSSFLVNFLRQEEYNLPQLEGLEVSRAIFTSFELEGLWPEALLYQTGYLTIQDVQKEIYTLGYPNLEVKHAFTEALLLGVTARRSPTISSQALKLPDYLQQERFSEFFETMRGIFASIPYDIEAKRDEAYFHTIFYLVLSASGMVEAQSSVLTCDGRIDMVARFPDAIYIFEFKCNQSAETALRQIRDKRYADRYRGEGRRIALVGINFNTEQRNIAEWKIQQDDFDRKVS